MPEISFFFFDLRQLFKLFPREDKQLKQQIAEYEQRLEENMAENRLRLFQE